MVDPTKPQLEIFWYDNPKVVQILRIGSLITAVTVISAGIKSVIPSNFDSINEKFIKLILESINFIALMSFCMFSINVPELEFNNSDSEIDLKSKYVSLLNLPNNGIDKAEKKIKRVNLLVKQLNNNVIYYALTLLVVYIVFILQGIKILPDDNLYAKAIADIFNYLSSVFLYLAFKVLYNKTLDDNNNKEKYYMDALFVSLFYILIYIILLDNTNPYVKNDLSLISGVFNGLAMGLLFSRFVSMEHVFIGLFENSNNIPVIKIKYKRFFYYGTIFILPLYSLAQPLFGDFKISEFGNPDVFANLVFLICFVGKFFFLIMLFIYTKKKLIHTYLHLVINKYGVPKDFVTFFNYND